MGRIYESATQLIGNTPILDVKEFAKAHNVEGKILAKLEYFNTTGSVKDRIALSIIEDAINTGKIKAGDTLIEPTSGNTGIALASIAAAKGLKLIIVMPETMSVERRNIIKAYGATIVLTEGAKGMKGAIQKAKELNEEIKGSFIPGQFENPANPKAHYERTGPEIFEDTNGNLDVFIAGVGTGGTITGTSKYLKEKNKNIEVIAIEPEDSPVLSKNEAGPHKIQGIGAGFVPEVLDTASYDEVITVSNDDAFEYAKSLAKTEGVLVGISAGAALKGAVSYLKREENKGKTVVVVLPDSGDRYYSTPLFQFD